MLIYSNLEPIQNSKKLKLQIINFQYKTSGALINFS